MDYYYYTSSRRKETISEKLERLMNAQSIYGGLLLGLGFGLLIGLGIILG